MKNKKKKTRFSCACATAFTRPLSKKKKTATKIQHTISSLNNHHHEEEVEEVYKKINATFFVVNNHIQNIHFVNALNEQKKFCGMNNKKM